MDTTTASTAEAAFRLDPAFWEELRQRGARVFPVGKRPGGAPILCAGFGNLHQAAVFCGDLENPQGAEPSPASGVLGRLCRDLARCCCGETQGPLAGLSVARGLEDQGVLLLPQLPLTKEEQDVPFSCQTGAGGKALCRVCKGFSVRHMVRLHRGEKGLRWQCGRCKPSPRAAILGQLLCSASGLSPTEPIQGAYTAADWFADCFARPAFEIGLGQAQGQGEETALYARLLETLVIATLV